MQFPGNQVVQVEEGPSFFGFGSDIGGGRTEGLLQYLSDRFGPVSSFTGTYRADQWTVNIPEAFINQASFDIGMLTATRCYCQVNSQSILLPLVCNKQ